MKIINETDNIDKKITELIEKYKEIYIATAWATFNTKASQKLLGYQNKIKMMVVGTYGFGTSPEFIEKFLTCENVKYYMKDEEKLFHPKIYLFYSSQDEWECLLGSANFTNGGFNANLETFLHINSRESNVKFVEELKNEIQRYFKLASLMNKKKLEKYKDSFEKNKKTKKEQKDTSNNMQTALRLYSLDSFSWSEYYSEVLNKDKTDKTLDMRIKLLELAQGYFQEYSASNMPNEILKQISGVVKNGIDKLNIEWWYFGNMIPARAFRASIEKFYKQYLDALELIPLTGKVTRDHYMNFIKNIKKINSEGYAVSSLSRLLAMRRPDVFFCTTKPNSSLLYEVFNIKPFRSGSKEFERYWDDMIMSIHNTSWFNSSQPKNKDEKCVWKARVAMLDMLTYKI